MKKIVVISLLLFSALHIIAQETEFTRGFIMHMRLHSGMVTRFNSNPELYAGGLQFIPQVSIINGKMRGGLIAGGFLNRNKLHGIVGPTVSVKLKTLNASVFGSAGNIHLAFDHLWGSGQQRLAGGGIYIDLLNKLILGLSTHRDYNLNEWWLQTSMSIRISRIKRTEEPFN